jgi:hypothetical protein
VTFSRWDLPGPDGFVTRLTERVMGGGSASVVLPVLVEPEALEWAIRRRLEYWRWESISVGAFDDGSGAPADLLAVALGMEGGVGRATASRLLDSEDLERTVLWVSGLEALDDSRAGLWLRFADDFARAAVAMGQLHPPALIIVQHGRANASMPRQQAQLPRIFWWGVVDRLDVMVHIARLSPTVDPIVAAQIVETAGFDLDLTERLLEGPATSVEEIVGVAAEYGERWDLRIPARVEGGRCPREAPGVFLEPWSRGLVDRFDGDSLWHVAALARDGKAGSITRRLWTAQVRTLMPRIDIWRLKLIEIAIDRRLLSEDDAPLDMEFADLHRALARAHRVGKRHSLHDIARWLREQRNRLAHLEVVSPDAWKEGERLANRAGLT